MRREKTKIFLNLLWSIFFVFSFLWPFKLAESASPIISIVSDEVSFEEGKNFSAKVLLDTSGESIKKAELIINYDKEILRVIDQDFKEGIQISEQTELGSFQKNIVNEETGVIEISLSGEAKDDPEIVLANILFEPIIAGRTEVKIDVTKSNLVNEAGLEIGFRVKELTATKIAEDRSGLKVIHVQNTYLTVENEPIQIEAGLNSPVPILEFKLFYRKMGEDELFNEKWSSVDMLKSQDDPNKYIGDIPARHIERPGITYYFTIRTTNRQTTMPRPITLENIYKMKVVTAEEFYDKEGPILNFNPPEAEFLDQVTVVVTSDDLASTNYCTFDGTEPTTSSYIYLNPFIFEESVTLKCFGVDESGNKGAVNTGVYTKKKSDLIANLTADKMQIDPGDEVILTWSTSNATKVLLAPEVGEVSFNGQKNVYPDETTSYTLTVSDELENVLVKTVTIYVARPGGGAVEEGDYPKEYPETEISARKEDYYPPESPATGVSDFLMYLYFFVTSGGVVYKMRK